jgi:hypothetical protein
MHAPGEATTMVVATPTNVHWHHHHREVNGGPCGGWRWPFNAFLCSVPLNVIATRVLQRTRFHVKASFRWSNRFPDARSFFAQPHREALHLRAREQAEVGHFPPTG